MPRRTSQDSQEAQVERLSEYQRILGAFARTASEGLSRERLMQHATALASRATHIKRVKVMRYRADPGDLLIEAGVGWKPGIIGVLSLPIDRASPPGRALQTASPSRRRSPRSHDQALAVHSTRRTPATKTAGARTPAVRIRRCRKPQPSTASAAFLRKSW